jgi:ankyrin repeat protein
MPIHPIHAAASRGDTDDVTALLRDDPSLAREKGGMEGWTPMAFAAEQGRVGVLRLLLDNLHQSQSSSEDGPQALILAAARGCLPSVELLLDADVLKGAGSEQALEVSHACVQGT